MTKKSLANKLGWCVVLGGLFLAGYQGFRSQSVVYERDFLGRVTSIKLRQLGIEHKLVADPKNPNKLVVEGNHTLNGICDSIGDGAKGIYNGAQYVGRKLGDKYFSSSKEDKEKK